MFNGVWSLHFHDNSLPNFPSPVVNCLNWQPNKTILQKNPIL